ncbi:MAG: hypothetical protein ABFS22_01835 [Pseudomonadota bacterium]
MNTTLINTIRTLLLTIATIALLYGAGTAEARDKWQERLLFNPPPSQLEQEKRGRIMIYDGLMDTQIEQAMDSQFDRIESMMFVRTIVTDVQGNARKDADAGTVMVEDDGC